ncbi:MAG: hypothetical protein QGG40_21445 [Myxococcota bacterium]|nr:hypothetical protein [Myxococcota bacterium]
MQGPFEALFDGLCTQLTGEEILTGRLVGEHSDFVRLNRGRIRQPGSVTQAEFTLRLVLGSRHAEGTVSLTGQFERDAVEASALLQRLRERLPHLPEDPHLLLSDQVCSTEDVAANLLPDPTDAIDDVLEVAHSGGRNPDLVGIYTAGAMHRGFANSHGQRNWFTSHSYQLDWSLYHQADKAVKTTWSGVSWDRNELGSRMSEAFQKLAVLSRPAHTVPPGRYRVALEPAAVGELMAILVQGGAFSQRAQRTRCAGSLSVVTSSIGTRSPPQPLSSKKSQRGPK